MSYWSAGAAAGGAVLGAFNSGSNAEHIGSDELYADWMKDDIKNLQGNISNLQTPQYYQGQLIAGQNPMLQGSLQHMYNFGTPGGAGGQMSNNLWNRGAESLQYGQQGGIDYMNMMNASGPNTFQYDQGTYDQSFGNLSGGMQNAFDVNSQNIQQGFDYNFLPGLNMANALGGGGGNTKFGQAGALGQAQANQNIMGMGVDLYQQAAFGADRNAMGAGGQNLASANNFDQNMMNNYGRMAQQGGNWLGDAYDMGTGNIGLQNRAGMQQQGYDQSLIDAQMDKWNYEQQAPWLAQGQLQDFTNQWINPNAMNYGNSPFQNALAVAQTAAGVAQAGGPEGAGWWNT